MTTPLGISLLAQLGVALAMAGPLRGQASVEVERMERTRFTAQVARDTATLRAILSDDLVYIHSNGLVEDKNHFIESVGTGRIVYDSLVPSDLKHRVYGSTAVGTGKVRVQVQMNGQTVRVDLLFTTVHLKRGGWWQLVNWQSTRAQP
jgi:Domain of unknown function (DUF4440)